VETRPDLPAVECAYASHPGRDPDKQVNEDAYGYEKTALGHLCVLCDGMGGHQNGREAAQLAVEVIMGTFVHAPPAADVAGGPRGRELLEQAIVAANARVALLGQSSNQPRPGSTVVAILMHPEGVEVAHVGDSRCYLVQGGRIFQITKDHTVVQNMIDAQLLTPAQAAVHPDANQILRALGASSEVNVEVRAQTIPLVPGDAFVLCSDGLSDLVDPAEVARLVTEAAPAEAVEKLVELANARGGHDNVTVMILRAREGARQSHREGGEAVREPTSAVAQTLFEVPHLPSLQAVQTHPLPIGVRPRHRRPGFPVALALGVLLAVIGFGAGGFAIYLVLNPNHNRKNVAPFALTGAPLATAPPSVALVPVAPDALAPRVDVGFDSGLQPAPLPPLVPSRRLRRGHGP
jgi:serine/threonine protein phosphatase PrpC